MFLRGAGYQTVSSPSYGSDFGTYQLDAINYSFGKGSIVTTATDIADIADDYENKNFASGVFSYEKAFGYRVGGDRVYGSNCLKINFDMTTGQNTANEFRSVNYAVYYIMKIK